jgi:hypothetical protein
VWSKPLIKQLVRKRRRWRLIVSGWIYEVTSPRYALRCFVTHVETARAISLEDFLGGMALETHRLIASWHRASGYAAPHLSRATPTRLPQDDHRLLLLAFPVPPALSATSYRLLTLDTCCGFGTDKRKSKSKLQFSMSSILAPDIPKNGMLSRLCLSYLSMKILQDKFIVNEKRELFPGSLDVSHSLLKKMMSPSIL